MAVALTAATSLPANGSLIASALLGIDETHDSANIIDLHGERQLLQGHMNLSDTLPAKSPFFSTEKLRTNLLSHLICAKVVDPWWQCDSNRFRKFILKCDNRLR